MRQHLPLIKFKFLDRLDRLKYELLFGFKRWLSLLKPFKISWTIWIPDTYLWNGFMLLHKKEFQNRGLSILTRTCKTIRPTGTFIIIISISLNWPWWLSGLSHHVSNSSRDRRLGPRFKSPLGIMILIAQS